MHVLAADRLLTPGGGIQDLRGSESRSTRRPLEFRRFGFGVWGIYRGSEAESLEIIAQEWAKTWHA